MLDKKHRLGIIGSSGGSALAAADLCLRNAGINIEWIVISDRECKLNEWAQSQSHSSHRLIYSDVNEFSKNALNIFESNGCSQALLFYTRKVAAPLIKEMDIYNIHPALLPAFVGLNAIEQAANKGVKIFGATLHLVDEGLDTGPIMAQVAEAWPQDRSLEHVHHLSFYQKVWLTLVWVERCIFGFSSVIHNSYSFSGLSLCSTGLVHDNLLESFSRWIHAEEMIWNRT